MKIIKTSNGFEITGFAWDRNKYNYRTFTRQEDEISGQRTYNVDDKKIP